ncbi:MAG: prepilin-type N-terminal cleavage/methylation domain-containing protein [Limnothrix sp. RL_2_0]|nr:prepilin-type N-terminal cleavage/methylation domain-containing protein [Limnothrix sp. RL_2_0]
MKSDLKAKLLQHFSKKKANGGFTLIELLVVIIIIGILSAIALPSFLNQANKAKQSEAKTYVGSMNRAQQAFYLENGRFTATLTDLGLGVASSTPNYSYTITNTAATGTGNGSVATNKAQAKSEALKGYAGGVALTSVTGTTDKTTAAVLCEVSAAGTTVPEDATADGSAVSCATATQTPIN